MSRQAPDFFSSAALITMVAGALGSLSLMFYTGRQNKSVLLMAAFAIWVLTPFVLLWIGSRMTSRLSASTRVVISGLMLTISIGSLVTYVAFFISPLAKPAAPYLIVPLIACVFSALVILLVETRSRKRKT